MLGYFVQQVDDNAVPIKGSAYNAGGFSTRGEAQAYITGVETACHVHERQTPSLRVGARMDGPQS